jgi:hypothetical protein
MILESSIRSIVERDLGGAFRLGELRAANGDWFSFDAWKLGSATTLSLMVRPRIQVDEDWEERFALVQQRVAELDHPHLLRTHRYGFTGHLVWVVTDRVEGTSLAELLDRVQLLDLQTSLRIAEQVASVLDYVHRRELGHGALSPDDIVIMSSGWVMVSGFSLGDQVEVEGPVALADQRALAAIVWRCLAGKAWDDADAGVDGHVPARVRTAIGRVLSGRAGHPARYGTVLELVSTLGAAEPDPERLILPVGDGPPIPWRRWIGPISAAALLLIALVGTIGAIRGRVESPSAAVTPAAIPSPPPAPTVPSVLTSAVVDSVVPPAPAPVRPIRRPVRPARTIADRRSPPLPPARLSVSSRPWGTLSLDGAIVAHTPAADLQVRPGQHVVRITRPGFRPREETIRVKPGAEVRLIDLVLTPATP